jgi:regulator of telomere elongation helicase 1
MVGILKSGPSGASLTSAYSRRDDSNRIDDLGQTVLKICQKTPEGVLVFFSSYGNMAKAIEKWSAKNPSGSGSIMEQLSKVKKVFMEEKSKTDFNEQFKGFGKCIHGGQGAVFFAVCRGKASEGIDFSDSMSRAVVICGIPFPALKDPKVILEPT